MSYIGNIPNNPAVVARQLVVDTINFDGVSATWPLTVDAVPQTVVSAANLIITVNGVIQAPVVAYNVSGTNLVFTSVPPAGSSFSGVILG